MTEIAARIQRLGRVSVLGICLALLAGLAGSGLFARALTLRGSVLPGVDVAGVDVGGLERADAQARIGAVLGPRLASPVEVAVGEKSFSVVPASLFELAAAATEERAFAAARDSFSARLAALAAPFAVRQHVDPVLRTRPEGRADLLAELFERTQQAVPARVRMQGKTPVVTPGRPGTQVDMAALVASVEAAALARTARVEARVTRLEPALSTQDGERAALMARTVVAAPVKIEYRGKRIGKLGTDTLAKLVRFQAAGGAYEVALERNRLELALRPLAAPFVREPRDADFRIMGKRVRVVPSRPGREVAIAEAEEAVLAAATGPGTRTMRLALAEVAPEFTTASAKALGIRERISSFTTTLADSSLDRTWNILLLGRYLDGTIVRAGKRFSLNKVIGKRTPERGFRVAPMILSGAIVPSVGGGVSQTATTIFNAAFEAGLPIGKRTAHSFYMSRYPIGRDATVSWGGPELVFRNDLDNAILIKSGPTSGGFTVSFYGTKQGRRVVAKTGAPTNYTQPSLHYAVDPSAPPGSVRVTESGGPGFDITVRRKVYENGKLIRKDRVFTRYIPQSPIRIYGPGANPPGPFFYLPSSA